MVNLITAKISELSTVREPAYRQVPQPVQKEIIPEEIKPVSDNKVAKTILPLGLIASGGLLIYYGLKKPNPVKFFNNLVKDRFFQIEKKIKEFSIFNKKLIDSSFKDADNLIDAYKRTTLLDISGFNTKIMEAADAKSAINIQDFAFESIQNSHNQFLRPGPSEFDRYKYHLYKISEDIAPQINHKKTQVDLACRDLTHLPAFKEGKHSDLVEEAETQLVALATSAGSEMNHMHKDKIHGIINTQTKKMAKEITRTREHISTSKNLIIESSFKKIREALNLPESFKPTYSQPKTLDNYEKLTAMELKPHPIPEEVDEAFKHNIFLNILKTQDFEKITQKDLKNMFYMIPPFSDIKDIGIMIDRLRLRNEADKFAGKNNENFYKILIGKLEYLSNKLTELGEKELLERCSKDFDNISVEQRKAQVYYVYDVAKRLGFSDISAMDNYHSKNNSEYINLNIRKYINIIQDNPELYFS